MQLQKHFTSTKSIVINIAVTFIQAGVAFLAVNNWDFTNQTVIAGAVGAGASVVWNTIVKPWLKSQNILYK